jgi:membrane protease YdiL (CAAX protease family)
MSAAASRLEPERGVRALRLEPGRGAGTAMALRSVPAPIPWGALPAAASGLALLLARPWLVSRGIGSLGLAAVFVVLWAMSVASAPEPRPLQARGARLAVVPGPLGSVGVLAAGLLALMFVRFAFGPVPPLPVTAGAIALNTLAAVAEEAFFRRFLYGRLVPFGVPLAVVTSALAFALVHLPLYEGAVFWVDLGAGLLLGWQRWASGSWTVPAGTHALANLLAVLR